MKRKAIIPLLLGLGIGLVTVRFLINTIRTAQASSRSVNAVSVVRARQDIDAYEPITPEKVEVVTTADSALAPANDRIGSLDDLKDRVAAKAIPAGAAVLKAMLAPEGTPPGLPGRIPAGFRAVSVKIDEVSSVAYQIKPGDWVDVIVVMDIDAGIRGKKETIAEVIMQHVQVAAIGHTTNTPTPEDATTKVKPSKSATLLIPEDEVPKLHLAGTRGKLTLAMRGDDGQKRARPPSATLSELVAGMDTRMSPSGGTRGADKSPGLMKSLFGDFGHNQAADASLAVASRPPVGFSAPHTVLVRHGSAVKSRAPLVEQITFADAESSRIVEAIKGFPSHAAVTLKESANTRPPRDTRLSQENQGSDNVTDEQNSPDDSE